MSFGECGFTQCGRAHKAQRTSHRYTHDQSGRETLQAAGVNVADVQSKSDAREAFTVVGWHRSVGAVEDGQLESLGALLQQASEVRGRLSDVESILARFEGLVREMKDTDILPGRSVWDAATTLSPSLEGFDVAVTEGLDRVRTWLQLLTDVTERVRGARQAIEAVRNGQAGQYSVLSERVGQAVSAIEKLESRSSDLRQQLSEFADVTGLAADIADQLGPLADEVGTVFGEASGRLADAASRLRQFIECLREARSVLADARSRARQTRSQLLSRAASLANGDAPANTDGGASGGGAGATPTPTASPFSGAVFADDFESGCLSEWEQVVVPDPRNEDVVEWTTTEDAISGSYSAYCDTVGDANDLRTVDPIVDASEGYEISYRWHTDASNSRGIACKLANGGDGEAFETSLFARWAWTRMGTRAYN